MTDKVYSYVVIGMITGDHFIEDLKLRVPFRTPVPITQADFLNSKDLSRASQQGLVKVLAQASIPGPGSGLRNPTPLPDNTKKLEGQIAELQAALIESENARKNLETKIDGQNVQLSAILEAIKQIPAARTVTAAVGSQPIENSEVVGGEAPMFIPENIEIGKAARIRAHESQGDVNISEAAEALRKLRKKQAG